MKSILGITIVLLFGAFCLFQSSTQVGDLITSTEAKNVWAGSCMQDTNGGRVKVCFGSNCSSGGCGCKERLPWTSNETGAHLDAAVSCGTAYCTSPQTLSGTCAN